MARQLGSGAALAALFALAACGNPLDQVQTLDEVELAEDAPVEDLREDPASPGLFSGLLSGLRTQDEAVDPQGAAGDEAGDEAGVVTALNDGALDEDGRVAEEAAAETVASASPDEAGETPVNQDVLTADTAPPTPVRRAGLFGILRGLAGDDDARDGPSVAGSLPGDDVDADLSADTVVETGAETVAEDQSIEVASLELQTEPPVVSEPDVADTTLSSERQPRRAGLFGLLRLPASQNEEGETKSAAPSRRASNEPDVTAGAPLAFGSVGRVCDVSGRALGREVSKFPERGRRGYKLYDSKPGGTDPRAFYITGFADGCPRQVTAANVIFGAPSMHERLRYGLPADTLPSSRTDEAYKKLKSRICGVARSAPCGRNIDKLERNTVFVTMYESFTGNQAWSNLLLHDGAVYESDRKVR
ncbi:hypothetical protein ACS3SW_06560 [Roseobacteraceae bacterium S113]